jgi:hypothetical protein|tara:strand:+ start:67 stop:315 length:249 start_codon:yes stop_codon:yes gene_type:complete
MAKINGVQINYIDAHLEMASKAEISADQLMADQHFMLALEADALLTQERTLLAKHSLTILAGVNTLLSSEEYDFLEAAAHER